MIYAYDETVPIPTIDLYDSQLMAQSIANAKERYNKAEKRLDDLENQLGDFYSPFAKDMQWYKTNVEDRIKNTLDDLYSKGIDPLRSAEGRAALRQLERSVPKSIVTKMKANAALGEKRRDLIAQLKAKGLYSKDFDDFMRRKNGLADPESFSTIGPGGVLNTFEGTPYEYTDPNAFLTPIVKDVQEGALTKEEVESYPGYTYDPNYDYTGRTEGMLKTAITESMPSLNDDPRYQYLRDVARRQLINQNIANGGDPNYIPSEQEIDQKYIENSTGTVSRFITRPTAKLKESVKLQQALSKVSRGSRSSGGSNKRSQGVYSYLANAFAAAINSSPYSMNRRQRLAIDQVTRNSKSSNMNGFDVLDKLAVRDGSDAILAQYLNRKQIDNMINAIPYFKESDSGIIFTPDEIFADMNYAKKDSKLDKYNTITSKVNGDKVRQKLNDGFATLKPTGRSVFYEDKNRNIQHVIEVVASIKGEKHTMYLHSGAQYDSSFNPTGNMASAIPADQRVSKLIASSPNKTEVLYDPTEEQEEE